MTSTSPTQRSQSIPLPTGTGLQRYRRALPALLAAAVGLSGGVHAEEQDIRWYQVEMIVFANTDPAALSSELWDNDIELRYPLPLRFISNQELSTDQPEQDDAANDELAGSAGSEGTDPLLNARAAQLGAGEEEEQHSLLNPDLSAVGIRTDQALETEEQKQHRLRQLEFRQFPAETRHLNEAANRIARSASRRLLFHKAWLQSINARKSAPNLALTGGEQYDKQHELSGSILLYRERYLHLQLNLWFARFSINIGQEPAQWPILPPYPAPPSLRDDATSPDSGASGASPGTSDVNTLTQSFREAAQQQQDFSFSPLQPMRLNSEIPFNEAIEVATFGSQFSDFLDNQYLTDLVVLLSQKRRMRSEELHYIDHPLIGVLIQIMPYDEENGG